jgi:hypothetical protein
MHHDKDHTLYERTFGNHYFLIAISLCLILVLMGVLAERLDREISRAEQMNFEYRLAELKAAVRLMEAALISQGELGLASRFDGANPMDWLNADTSHYLGELSPDVAVAHPGNWFFDPIKQEIAYVLPDVHVQKGELDAAKISGKILRFKVLALRSKEDQYKFSGLVLHPVLAEADTESNRK